MKKVFILLTIVGVSIAGISVAVAKSQVATIQSGKSLTITKASTTAKLTTAVKASYIGRAPLWITNTVSRKNAFGIYEKSGENFFGITEINKGYPCEYTFTGIKDTKSKWLNETENAAISGTFYINNGLDSEK